MSERIVCISTFVSTFFQKFRHSRTLHITLKKVFSEYVDQCRLLSDLQNTYGYPFLSHTLIPEFHIEFYFFQRIVFILKEIPGFQRSKRWRTVLHQISFHSEVSFQPVRHFSVLLVSPILHEFFFFFKPIS